MQNEADLGHPFDFQRRVEPSVAGLGFRFDPAGKAEMRERADLGRERPEWPTTALSLSRLA
jgi:hypothetical protein